MEAGGRGEQSYAGKAGGRLFIFVYGAACRQPQALPSDRTVPHPTPPGMHPFACAHTSSRQPPARHPSPTTNNTNNHQHRSLALQVHMMEVMGDRPREEGLAWINLSPARFCQSFGYDLPEWERRRGKWEQSERAARYGLAQAAQRHGRRGPPAAQQQLGEGEADAQQG